MGPVVSERLSCCGGGILGTLFLDKLSAKKSAKRGTGEVSSLAGFEIALRTEKSTQAPKFLSDIPAGR